MMQSILSRRLGKITSLLQKKHKTTSEQHSVNNLSEAKINKNYSIKSVTSDDIETVNFLFTLGFLKGESVTLISVLSETYVIAIKDARYSIDADLAKAIILV